jgi:DNA polymerase III delta prime subunit
MISIILLSLNQTDLKLLILIIYMNNTYCPFVEKHRPTKFDDIVLGSTNKKILLNIIETSYFPNLLFYGPPGTGKTTTIINLVNAYQKKINNIDSGLMIHLNASDERGIDIIRNQINSFVTTKPLFNEGIKFVILDEVDYMTKNAQQALRYLLQSYPDNVRFCLICNYISKIDDGLQNEFLKLRFNQLPEENIINFLQKIATSENLNIGNDIISCVQKLYKSDIRSMINFMQSNQDILDSNYKIIDNNVWNNLLHTIISNKSIPSLIDHISNISTTYNIDKKNIINDFLNYIIRENKSLLNASILNIIENIVHNPDYKNYVTYALVRLKSVLGDID